MGLEANMKFVLFVISIAGLGLASQPASAQANSSGEEKVATVCQNCHGARGNSVSATFPRLNGQQADYLAAQLKSFRDHSRSDPHAMAYMWGMASQLDDATIDAVAKYLAAQAPTLPQTGGALSSEGQKIYAEGAAAQNIPACGACHGERGEGNGVFPRIAGQHADYLRKQLEDFRSLVRQNDVMHANTAQMTDAQIEAVVSYLAND
jgi:cytochrome c553